jgi:hypothetical protein
MPHPLPESIQQKILIESGKFLRKKGITRL